MAAAPTLSDDSRDKLKACLNHGWPDPDLDPPQEYLAACNRWFEALSPRARNTAVSAIAAYGQGDEIVAVELAGLLPPAPAFPAPPIATADDDQAAGG